MSANAASPPWLTLIMAAFCSEFWIKCARDSIVADGSSFRIVVSDPRRWEE